MNRPIRKVAVALGVLFAALFVNLNVVQVLQSDEYRNDPTNRRVLLEEYSHPRGSIVVQGKAIADSIKTNDELKYLRQYPQGPLYAAVTGYYSYVYGSSGIEGVRNQVLSGDDERFFTTQFTGLLTGRDPRGGNVELTLNRAAQQAAYDAMKNPDGSLKRGAVVALDPTTGAVLALVSTPSFDPTVLSSHNPDAITHAYACYNSLDDARKPGETQQHLNDRIQAQLVLRQGGSTLYKQRNAQNPSRYPLSYLDTYTGFGSKGCGDVPEDPTAMYRANPSDPGPLYDRALRQVYAAGSVFKVIVAAQALKQNRTPETRIAAPNSYWPGDPARTTPCPAGTASPCVSNFDREQCDDGKTATLEFALAKSCNTAFAALLADQLDLQGFISEAQSFGLDAPYRPGQYDACDPPAMEIPLAVCSSTPGSTDDFSDVTALARVAFGQRDVRITPLQAAMISAAVANNGTLMQPYLVSRELGPTLSVVSETQPKQLDQVLEPGVDAQLQQMMEAVVTSPEGTGASAAIPGVTVGGKTGTADTGIYVNGVQTPPHAWFSGFALKDGQPKIAVAVIIENGGVAGNETTGGLAAAPVAKAVMQAYLDSPQGSK
ncbi:MAG: penicillin-binding transpeptidase domain-containing protein [Jatrophihabitans sp.]|uniref:penicillin-binding transpeptidase domain-containing protein n=1 Tax=Jatrophihabitans sp. TaxID=1932789 RepID=UPI003F7EEA16